MNIDLVQSFLTVCEFKSISAASDHLNISQQGLSRQIRILEAELNVKLFKRTTKGVTLTESGNQLKPSFESMLNSYNEIKSISRKFSNAKNKSILLGFGNGITSAIDLEFIEKFNELHPDVTIEILEYFDEDCFNKLSEGYLDFAFLVEPFDKSNLNCVHVFSDTAYAAVSPNHEFATRKNELHLTDLDKQTIFTLNRKYVLRKYFDDLCAEKKIQPNILFSSNSVASYIHLASNSNAMIIILGFMRKYIKDPSILHIPIVDAPVYKVNFCQTSKKKSNKILNDFYDFTVNYFKG